MDEHRRYLAMLSHDIKSAISGVIGALQQLESAGLDAPGRKYRDGALESALAAARLLDGALDLEAIDRKEFQLQLEEVSIDSFLSELHRRWNAAASAKWIELHFRRDTNLPDSATIDRGRLSRALGNLIENAIKYTDTGSVELTIGRDGEHGLIFSITDNGPGFSPDALQTLFQFRGRPETASKPGSGLGLYIAHTVVEQMNGRIDVSNRAGGTGACVQMRLPNAVTPLRQGPQPDRESDFSVAVLPSSSLPDLSHLYILLAEDNATNQLVASQMLEAMGARFEVASDGIEALKLFERHDFNLLLLDIEMPRMSGLQVIQTIRARNDARANVTIVALTAYAMREHRERIAAAGADGLIPKPILGIENLGEAILGYAKRRTQEEAALAQDIGSESDEIVDHSVIDMLAASIGAEKMTELLQKVGSDLRNVRSGISSGIDAKDTNAIRAASHVLISVAGAIGANRTQHLAEALNRAAHADDASELSRMSRTCMTSIDDLLEVVEKRLRD